jgi:hypothetical protein
LQQRKRERSTKGTPTEPDLGGLTLFSGTLALEGLGNHPSWPWHHPALWMSWEADWAVLARVASWRSPRRANVLLLDAPFVVRRANVSLRGDSTLFFV